MAGILTKYKLSNVGAPAITFLCVQDFATLYEQIYVIATALHTHLTLKQRRLFMPGYNDYT